MTEILKILANKINDPTDIFIYLFIVFLFVIIAYQLRILLKQGMQLTRVVELLNVLVYRNNTDNEPDQNT